MEKKMNKIGISIVTYNPNLEKLNNALNVYKKLNLSVNIYDNGSKNYTQLKKMSIKFSNIYIITENKNLGIAYALNKNFALSKKHGLKWVITFDQDSVITEEFLKKYLVDISKLSTDSQIAIICTKVLDKNTGKIIFGKGTHYERIKDPQNIITSGSCIRVSSWENIDKFNDELFIDFVDTDFQERILLNGFKIVRCNNIVLVHEIGKTTDKKIGPFIIHCSNHNSFRRYYMVRNRLFFYRKYYGYFPYIGALIRLSLGTLKIVLFEKEKKLKVYAFLKGWRDYRKLM